MNDENFCSINVKRMEFEEAMTSKRDLLIFSYDFREFVNILRMVMNVGYFF